MKKSTIVLVLLSIILMIVSACASQPTAPVPAETVQTPPLPQTPPGELGEVDISSGDLAGQAVSYRLTPETACTSFAFTDAAFGCSEPLSNVELVVDKPISSFVKGTLVKYDRDGSNNLLDSNGVIVTDPADANKVPIFPSGLPRVFVFPVTCLDSNGNANTARGAGGKCTDAACDGSLASDQSCFILDRTGEDRDVLDFHLTKPTAVAGENIVLYRIGYVYNRATTVWEPFEWSTTTENGATLQTVRESYDLPSDDWYRIDAIANGDEVNAIGITGQPDPFIRVPGKVNFDFGHFDIDATTPGDGVNEHRSTPIAVWACSCPENQCDSQATWKCNGNTVGEVGISNGKYVLQYFAESEANLAQNPNAPTGTGG
jgi:hypothetical protein